MIAKAWRLRDENVHVPAAVAALPTNYAAAAANTPTPTPTAQGQVKPVVSPPTIVEYPQPRKYPLYGEMTRHMPTECPKRKFPACKKPRYVYYNLPHLEHRRFSNQRCHHYRHSEDRCSGISATCHSCVQASYIAQRTALGVSNAWGT